jgi:wobble nucleotide-excising tRNase
MDELPYDTLKDFENKVKEYQKMLDDPNYKKGLEKGKKKMQSEIDRLSEEITYLKSLLKV